MIAALWMSVALASEPVVEPVAGGKMNWTVLQLRLSAGSNRSVGAWKDRRVQEQDALDQLSPLVITAGKDLRVTPTMRAGDLLGKDDALSRRLASGLRAWQVDETRYVSGGSVAMDGVLDVAVWLQPALLSLSDDAPVADHSGSFTGVVVDARDLPVEPCLAPRITTPDNTVLFEIALISADAIRSRTPVTYVSDPADPRGVKRAGDRPLFGRIAEVHDGCDLVLAPDSALALSANPELRSLVSHAKVVVVVAP